MKRLMMSCAEEPVSSVRGVPSHDKRETSQAKAETSHAKLVKDGSRLGPLPGRASFVDLVRWSGALSPFHTWMG
eukprot:5936905-Prymnesium_polylepis.1